MMIDRIRIWPVMMARWSFKMHNVGLSLALTLSRSQAELYLVRMLAVSMLLWWVELTCVL